MDRIRIVIPISRDEQATMPFQALHSNLEEFRCKQPSLVMSGLGPWVREKYHHCIQACRR